MGRENGVKGRKEENERKRKKGRKRKIKVKTRKGRKGKQKLGELLKALGACTFRQLLFEFDINQKLSI